VVRWTLIFSDALPNASPFRRITRGKPPPSPLPPFRERLEGLAVGKTPLTLFVRGTGFVTELHRCVLSSFSPLRRGSSNSFNSSTRVPSGKLIILFSFFRSLVVGRVFAARVFSFFSSCFPAAVFGGCGTESSDARESPSSPRTGARSIPPQRTPPLPTVDGRLVSPALFSTFSLFRGPLPPPPSPF